MHADAGRFRRGRAKRGQDTQKHEAAHRRETTAHDGLLHDFVRVAVPRAGSAGPAISRPARPAIFGIEPEPMALSSRTAPLRPAAPPNQMLTFRPCPRKLPETQKTDRTE